MVETLKSMTPKIFSTEHIAKFREIDPYGHMNTVYYLDYFIEHRFEGMRSIGITLDVIKDLPVAFYMKTVQLDMAMPVFAEQTFQITSSIQDLHEKAVIVSCEMVSGESKLQHATCQFDLVCVDKTSQRPCAWPHEFLALFFEPTQDGEVH